MVACQATQMPPSAASCTFTAAKPVHAPLSQMSWAPWYKARAAKTASNATWAFLPITGTRPRTCEVPHVRPDSIADDELRCTWKNMSFNFLFSALRSLRPADDACADARASFARAVTPDSIADDELRCTWKNMSFNFLFSALRSLRPADDACADARASFARAVDSEVSPI